MPINDAVARWCPTLDPNYGTTTLTDLIGGVGNFTLPSNTHWGIDGASRHLNWATNWLTHLTPGFIQRSSENFSVSLWMNYTSGIAWSALNSITIPWTGWYASANSGLQNPLSNDFSIGASLVSAATGWRHIVYRQQANTALYVSINGVHGAASDSIQNLNFGTYRFCLGAAYRFNIDNYFRGQQDDWIFYNRFITDAEVEAIYTAGRGGNLSGVAQSRRRRDLGGYGL